MVILKKILLFVQISLAGAFSGGLAARLFFVNPNIKTLDTMLDTLEAVMWGAIIGACVGIFLAIQVPSEGVNRYNGYAFLVMIIAIGAQMIIRFLA